MDVGQRRAFCSGIEAIANAAKTYSEMVIYSKVTPAHHIPRHLMKTDLKNSFGNPVEVHEVPTELGAAGCVHGAATAGALVSTISCGDALVLQAAPLQQMVGQGMPVVFNVPSRAVTRHESSMFPDHSDVMQLRHTGVGIICSSNVQQAYDFAVMAQLAAIRSKLPFIHFFDGTKILNQTQPIKMMTDPRLRELLTKGDMDGVQAAKLTPMSPVVRGATANAIHGNSLYFAAFERNNQVYDNAPGVLADIMKDYGRATGRIYDPVEYYGAPIRRVNELVIAMGSATETVRRVVDYLNAQGRSVGLMDIQVFRPFPYSFVAEWIARMQSLQAVTVLDRCDEPAPRQPLYYDILETMSRAGRADVPLLGGIHGIGGHTISSNDVAAIYDNMQLPVPRDGLAVGLRGGGVTHNTISLDHEAPLILDMAADAVDKDIMIFGTGTDGTRSVSRAMAAMVSQTTNMHVSCQYRESDERMALGQAATMVHIGGAPHDDPYMQRGKADFVGINVPYLANLECLDYIKEGAMVVINMRPDTNFDEALPQRFRQIIAEKHAKLYALDIGAINAACGLSPRKQSTAMLTACICLFLSDVTQPHSIWRRVPRRRAVMHSVGSFMSALLDILPRDIIGSKTKRVETSTVISMTSNAIEPSNGKNTTLCNVPAHDIFRQVRYSAADWAGPPPAATRGTRATRGARGPDGASPQGESELDGLPLADDIRAMAYGGRTHVMQEQEHQHGGGELRRDFETIAKHVPKWMPQYCTQCYRCSLLCPHGALRIVHWKEDDHDPEFRASLRYDEDTAPDDAPFIGLPARLLSRPPVSDPGFLFRVQLSPLQCTECGVCYSACPTKALVPSTIPVEIHEQANRDRARSLSYVGPKLKHGTFMDPNHQYSLDDVTQLRYTVEGSQLFKPLYVSDGSCPGCGIPGYLKLITQLLGANVIFVGSDGCITTNLATVNSSALQTDTSTSDSAPCFTRSTPANAVQHASGIVDRLASMRAGLRNVITTELADQAARPPVANPYHQPSDTGYLPTPMLEQVDLMAGLRPALERWLERGDNPDHARDIHDFVAFLCHEDTIASYYTPGDPEQTPRPYSAVLDALRRFLLFMEPIQVLTVGNDKWARAQRGPISTAMQSSKPVKILVADSQYQPVETDRSFPTPIGQQHINGDAFVAQISLSDPLHSIQCLKRAFEFPGPAILVALAPCKDWLLSGGLSKSLASMDQAVDAGYWPLYSYDPERVGRKLDIHRAMADRASFDAFVGGQYRFATKDEAFMEAMWGGCRDNVAWLRANAMGG